LVNFDLSLKLEYWDFELGIVTKIYILLFEFNYLIF
jgi:hypothetical protein